MKCIITLSCVIINNITILHERERNFCEKTDSSFEGLCKQNLFIFIYVTYRLRVSFSRNFDGDILRHEISSTKFQISKLRKHE